MVKKVKPNVIAGGSAIDLGNNLFYMRGRTHKQGGIDIGKNPRTGIEVENGEVMQITPNNIRVFSAQPIFNGISPANALLMGGNPNSIFNAQELWKQEHKVNDDGTKFKDGGYTPSKEIIDYIKKTEAFRDKWYKDGNGIDTIGYGFTGSKVKKLFPNGITREQADKYFADSINRRIQILAKDTPNWNNLSQQQKDALLSYHYNVGESSYRNNHPKLQEALKKQDWENVMLNMDAGYNDKKNPGLRTRRDYERQLFRSGINSSSTGDEEKAFRDWYDTYARAHNLDLNPDAKEHYYDYRAYYKNRTKEQANEEWKLDSHLPDTYKLPGHPTFSIESIYSTRKTPGGRWKKVGLGPVYDEQFVDSKYTKRLKTYKNVSFKYGGIHIKPSKRGTFTAAAKRHNMSVQEFARTVLNNKANYSAAMIKKANFARNASKWNKKELGGDMTKQYFITPNNIYKLSGDIRKKAPLDTEEYERFNYYPTLEPLTPIASPGAVTPQTIVDNNRRSLVRLRGNSINIKNGADWLGLGINLAGNLAASLINRSAIKGMRYVDAPIPLSAQKLKTKINVNPQVDQIRENVAGQERLIADNTADSRVALARRQRVRNLGSEQFQSLMGQRENIETQLINRDRLNRQNIDAQNIGQYNQWRRGAYDFENRRREMLAENAVAGINNAAEAIAGERGILARREGRNRDILNAALIAATSPNAQNVIGSKEFAKFLEQLGYTGDFSLLRKRLNIG